MRTLSGHTDRVRCLAFSPDGQIAASGGKDCKVLLWDIRSSKQIGQLRGHDYPILSVAFTPDGRQVITSSFETADTFEDLSPEMLIRRKARKLIAKRHTLRLWDLKKRQVVHNFGGTEACFRELAVTPDGKTLLAVCNSVVLFDIASGKAQGLLQATALDVWKLEKNRRFTQRVKPINWRGFNPRAPDYGIEALVLTKDGRWALTAGHGGVMRLWDVEKRRLCQTFDVPQHYLAGLAFVPGSNTPAIAQYDLLNTCNLALSHVASGRCLGNVILCQGPALMGSWQLGCGPYWGNLLAALPDGQRVVVVSHVENELGRALRIVFGEGEERRGELAKKSKSGVRVWDLRTGRQTHTFVAQQGACLCFAISPDGKHALTGHEDGNLCLWGLPH